MSLGTFLIMRHELLLIAAALSVLIAEIFWNPDKRQYKSFFDNHFRGYNHNRLHSLSCRAIVGGMYVSSGTRLLMKNILNIGAFLVFYSVCHMAQ